jgi:AcrR family transcriptional regulator
MTLNASKDMVRPLVLIFCSTFVQSFNCERRNLVTVKIEGHEIIDRRRRQSCHRQDFVSIWGDMSTASIRQPRRARTKTRLKRKASHYHHGRLRQALIAAGRALIEQRGLHGFTLRECARRARVSHAAPAHHFHSIADLLAEIAAQGFDELAAAMDAAASGQRDPARRLAALGRAYVAFALANQAVFQLMLNRGARSSDNARLEASRKAAYARLTESIGSVIPHGSPATRQAMADLAWVSVHGFAVLALGGELDREGMSGTAFRRRLDAVLQVVAEAMARCR